MGNVCAECEKYELHATWNIQCELHLLLGKLNSSASMLVCMSFQNMISTALQNLSCNLWRNDFVHNLKDLKTSATPNNQPKAALILVLITIDY